MERPYFAVGESGDAWLSYCLLVAEKGKVFHDEGEEIIELRNVMVTFTDFDIDDSYFQGNTDKKIIELYKKKMESTEIVPELNASYGKRLYDQLGINQVEWVVQRLNKKPETKAATISLLLPDDPGPRIPCLCVLDFKIREDKLHLSGYFRSQNVIRSYGNFNSIRILQKKIAKQLKIKAGTMTFLISSAHYYKDDDKKIKELIKNNE